MLKYYFTRIFKTSFLSSLFPAIVLGRATAVSDFDFLIHTINQLCFLAPTVGFLIAAILILTLYYCYDKLFDMYSYRNIVFVFMGIVMLVILYSSLRLCFKKNKSE